jgi:DNA (cytosine-5)-methyltransferase 1
MKAIDLYSGIGGWTLGMKLAGIENVTSFEWWNEANLTHNVNFNTDHKERDIRELRVEKDLKFKNEIDFVVGSPPCTQFSFANRGGNGDIQDGLVDIRKFLEVVRFLKPKYWAMENVPRVAKILEKELTGSLKEFKDLVKVIRVVDCSDYGVPQSRKRMIAGDFPIDLFESYKGKIRKKTLGEVITALSKKTIIDPNYGYRLDKGEVTEMGNEPDLTLEEERINRDLKTFHPIYNKMSFPDNMNKPSRTITATCTRVSRESIIVKSKNGYRRLNVRERGVIQGFPITYQFYGKSLSAKFKMIGNAVPPILTYYLFNSMLHTKAADLVPPSRSLYIHKIPKLPPFISKLTINKPKYSVDRKFQFAVPNLRFGSGVRFELSNISKGKNSDWSFKFFHGTSKNIKQVGLDGKMKDMLAPIINTTQNEIFTQCVEKIKKEFYEISSASLQSIWTSPESNVKVFEFLDKVGENVEIIINNASFDSIENGLLKSILKETNKKLLEDQERVLTGFYFLSSLNSKLLHNHTK